MSLGQRLAQAKRSQDIAAPEQRANNEPTAHVRSSSRKDPFADVKRSVHAELLGNLGPKLYDPHMGQAELEQTVRQTLQKVVEQQETPLSNADRARLTQEVADDILGYGPIEPMLRDPDVTEVMVNGPSQIYVEASGKLTLAPAQFADEAHLRRTIEKIVARVGRRIDEASPMVDARLPDGSRVNAVVPPIALDGSMLTIRKFAADPFRAEDLVSFGTMSAQTWHFL